MTAIGGAGEAPLRQKEGDVWWVLSHENFFSGKISGI